MHAVEKDRTGARARPAGEGLKEGRELWTELDHSVGTDDDIHIPFSTSSSLLPSKTYTSLPAYVLLYIYIYKLARIVMLMHTRSIW